MSKTVTKNLEAHLRKKPSGKWKNCHWTIEDRDFMDLQYFFCTDCGYRRISNIEQGIWNFEGFSGVFAGFLSSVNSQLLSEKLDFPLDNDHFSPGFQVSPIEDVESGIPAEIF